MSLFPKFLPELTGKKITILGYYGQGNLGDELLLTAILFQLNKLSPKPLCRVISRETTPVRNWHKVEAISRNNPLTLLAGLFQSDIVLFGGGEILQDQTSNRSLYYYLGCLALGRLFGKAVYLWGVDFSPALRPFNRWLTVKLLKKCKGIAWRSLSSYNRFLSLALHPLPFTGEVTCLPMRQGVRVASEYCPDPVFTLPDEFFQQPTDSNIIPRTPFLLISLSPGRVPSRVLDDFLLHLVRLQPLKNFTLVFLPFHLTQDLPWLEKILAQRKFTGPILIRRWKTPTEVLPLFQASQGIITQRLHGAILAHRLGKPFLSLESNPEGKLPRYCAENNLSNYSLPEGNNYLPWLVEHLTCLLRSY